jgi:transposase-like protein
VATKTVKCPFCGSEKVSKNGHSKIGKQVYNCNNIECNRRNFIEEYTKKEITTMK